MAIFHSALEGENSVLLSRSLSVKMTDLSFCRETAIAKVVYSKSQKNSENYIFKKVRN